MHKKGSITSEMRHYLLPTEIRAGKLQANPKIHKSGNPVRTIVNGQNHPTEKLAEFVESQLEENNVSLKSYVKDTTDFLRKLSGIEQPLPNKAKLFCMDVRALYPSVPRKEAREAAKIALENRKDKMVKTEDILALLDSVLENNNFAFNGKNYIQTEGTAIGSKLGRNYACTYMGEWEKKLLETCEKKPSLYLRYIDDIFGIWDGTEEELKLFHKAANSVHSNIEVDLRFSEAKIDFLDVTISIENGFLTTDLYAKPTDKHMYLNRNSSHPETTKSAIPYGLGIRAKRICSSNDRYKSRRTEIKRHLVKRGYGDGEVEHQLSRVDSLDRKDLLEYKNKTNKNNDRVPIVLTFSRGLPSVNKILRKRHQTLLNSDRLSEIFPKQPIIAFRRDKNLQDILVHKKHNNMFFKKSNKCEPCGAKKCAICKYVQTTSTFKDASGKVFYVRNYINCKSTNVVYSIYCKKCQKIVYVGETGDTLYQRHLLNLSLIRRQANDPVALHFCTNEHNVDDFTIIGLEKLYKDDMYRKNRENLWKKKLNTFYPYGINTKEI